MADRGEEDEDAADATQAFKDLRAEVAVLRQAVQVLPGAWEENRPADTTPTLGAIAKGLAGVAGRLEAIEKHPALRLTPDQHRQAIAQAGQGAMQQLERATQGLAHERWQLARPNRECAAAGGATRVASLNRVRSPGSRAAAVAAGDRCPALRAGRPGRGADHGRGPLGCWCGLDAGSQPDTWEEVAAAFQLTKANSEALDACGAAAAKAGKDQRCTITVTGR